MISPRSYIYSRQPSPSSSPTSSACISPISSPSTSPQSSISLFRQYIYHTHQRRNRHQQRSRSPSRSSPASCSSPITIGSKTSGDSSRRTSISKYDYREFSSPVTSSISPIRSTASASPSSASITTISFFDDEMGKRKERLEASLLASMARSPPESTTSSTPVHSRPPTPTSPVLIPKSNSGQTAHPPKRHSTHRRRPRHPHSTDDLPASLASLLASTDIPRQRSQRRKRRSDKPLTVDDILGGQQLSEKEISLTLSRGPMSVLLSPPEEFADDDISIVSDGIGGSALSTRTMSVDSIPSLGESYATDGISSVETPCSPMSSLRGRRMSPMRRSLEPILSPPGEDLEHPLASDPEADEMALNPLPESIEEEEAMPYLLEQFKPLKYAFKSNLTASLRALRSAAKSFSTINFSSIPSDDFLTRSLLTIDTKVPYADERRPPVTEDMPSAEIRRYLNPTTTSRLEIPAVPPAGKFSASIQMQTYKVHRSKLDSARPRSAPHVTPQRQQQQGPPSPPPSPSPLSPLMRQREMRENSDFIRIAVMEMMMRKNGKLDDQRPGRARWALPPRKMPTGTYEVGPNGVPTRWVSVSY